MSADSPSVNQISLREIGHHLLRKIGLYSEISTFNGFRKFYISKYVHKDPFPLYPHKGERCSEMMPKNRWVERMKARNIVIYVTINAVLRQVEKVAS
jgi:hypothetical protein